MVNEIVGFGGLNYYFQLFIIKEGSFIILFVTLRSLKLWCGAPLCALGIVGKSSQ